jgi:hypothetical protein
MGAQGLTLATNASATGNGQQWRGGKGTVFVDATFSGGTVKLQASRDNSTWVDVSSATSFTANGTANFEISACYLRCNIATATAVNMVVGSI